MPLRFGPPAAAMPAGAAFTASAHARVLPASFPCSASPRRDDALTSRQTVNLVTIRANVPKRYASAELRSHEPPCSLSPSRPCTRTVWSRGRKRRNRRTQRGQNEPGSSAPPSDKRCGRRYTDATPRRRVPLRRLCWACEMAAANACCLAFRSVSLVVVGAYSPADVTRNCPNAAVKSPVTGRAGTAGVVENVDRAGTQDAGYSPA